MIPGSLRGVAITHRGRVLVGIAHPTDQRSHTNLVSVILAVSFTLINTLKKNSGVGINQWGIQTLIFDTVLIVNVMAIIFYANTTIICKSDSG
jgi:EamA domain-containing membrane protein RarD